MAEYLSHNGVKIPYDREVISDDVARAISKGRYEKSEMKGLPKFIEPGDRIVELGAGLGFISSFVGVHLGVTETLCIEANPGLVGFIARTHAANGLTGIEVRNCVALGGGSGTLPFYIREPFWASSLDGTDAYARIEDVPVEDLTAILRGHAATTLIVDIEGGEEALFQGLDLVDVTKVYLELHTRRIRQIGIKRCFDALSNAGFAYDQRVSDGGSVLFRKIPARQLAKSA